MPVTFEVLTKNINGRNLQVIELWVICREFPDRDQVEIAENPNGSLKAFPTKAQATRGLEMSAGWKLETIWMVHKGCDMSEFRSIPGWPYGPSDVE